MLGKVESDAAGVHGWYKQITEYKGIKIYEELNNAVSLEYLITKYVWTLGILCTNVIGFGMAKVGVKDAYDKYLAQEKGSKHLKVNARPVMVMEHIQGLTLQQVIDIILKRCPAEIKSYDDKYTWVWNQPELLDILIQFNYIIKTLQDAGLELDDHLENYDNFMVDEYGNLHIIDFSFEAHYASPELISKVISTVGDIEEVHPLDKEIVYSSIT